MRKGQKVLIVLICLFILASGSLFNYFLYGHLESQDIDIGQPLVTVGATNISPDNLQQMIHEAQKSIVQINVETIDSTRVGSGFIYNSRGDIVTNAHVISDAISIEVTIANAETYPAAIVGIGAEKDIAVIRVPQLINQPSIELETSGALLPGTEIIAVGSPLGFTNTVSLGIISGVDRSFDINGYTYENVYQISASITHGNSGGPLINRSTGKVIGVNSAGIEESEIGFSIPIPAIIDDIMEWSSSTTNEQLTFPKSVKDTSADPEILLEDISYLLQYFIDSISMHDYINAYRLLGSDMQNEMDYPSFRSNYLDLKSIELIDYIEEETTNEAVVLTVNIQYDDVNRESDKHEITYLITIGYENDQLKILNLQI